MEHQCVKLTHKLTKNHGNTPSRCRTEPHATQTENQLKDYRNLVNLAPMARFASIVHGKFKNSRFFCVRGGECRLVCCGSVTSKGICQRKEARSSSTRSHKSHNAPVLYPTMHNFATEMCVHFYYKMVHCGIYIWHIVGFWDGLLFTVLLDLAIESGPQVKQFRFSINHH